MAAPWSRRWATASRKASIPRTGLLEVYSAALAQHRDYKTEYRLRRADGSYRWILSSAIAKTDADRRMAGFIGTSLDITERKNAEVALREAKELAETTTRTKSEFLANMSYELRTPLNAIMGFSEIIKSELFGPLGDRNYKTYASDIYESGRHLLNLINDILDVSKAEAGKIELHEMEVEDGDEFVLSVRDTGIGIAAEDIAKALAPFGQVDSKLARRYDGTGLGLPLSRVLAELNGGKLNLASRVGAGTTARVRLPADHVLAGAPAEAMAAATG